MSSTLPTSSDPNRSSFQVSGYPLCATIRTGASLARPGGNATGINASNVEVVAKRLGLRDKLAPKAVRVAVLVNPGNAAWQVALAGSGRIRPSDEQGIGPPVREGGKSRVYLAASAGVEDIVLSPDDARTFPDVSQCGLVSLDGAKV
jgi:hypothetical protein